MSKTLIRDYGGVRSYESFDEGNDCLVIRHESDAQTAVDWTRNIANENTGRCSDIQHVASVPIAVQYEWMQKFGVRMWDDNHKGAVQKLLDGEYRYLKTKDIILSDR
jgi:hypothetical protein